NDFNVEGVLHLANGATQSVNLDDALRARGITTPDQLYRDYDINYSSSRAIDDNNLKAFPARLTWQANQKNRFTTMFDWANKIRGHRNLSVNVNVDAAVQQAQPAEHIYQAKWTSTLTNH